ncbi:dnaJ homolog subfamily C member 30, mitochondrial [Nomia melanderi]|uniref:dnaJ homolog subfamily C member 30, mitochondrial n=1 Tax=Nomia melanderi TaxID=2448451 RepID=UPI003FCC30AB
MFIQYPTCFNTRIMIKILKRYTLIINMKMNFSTESKTHYDTLKISSNATHNEIKSAYYKLTLEYHPDRNKSKTAKEIFQQVSDAYEVLGNHKLRKQYDRTIVTKHLNIRKYQDTKIVRDHSTPSTGKIFDFDEWSKEHYGIAFERQMKRNANFKEYLKYEKYTGGAEEHKVKTDKRAVIVSVCALIIVFILFGKPQHDEFRSRPKRRFSVAPCTDSNQTVILCPVPRRSYRAQNYFARQSAKFLCVPIITFARSVIVSSTTG